MSGMWIWRGLWISLGLFLFWLNATYPFPNVDSLLGKGLGLTFVLFGLFLNPKEWQFELPFRMPQSIVLLIPLAFLILTLSRIQWGAPNRIDALRGIWALIVWGLYLYPFGLRLWKKQRKV